LVSKKTTINGVFELLFVVTVIFEIKARIICMQDTKKNMPPLNALKAFEATARLKSLTKAAQELHVTQGAVSQQVKLLEEYLGLPLFIRKSRKLILTDLARSYLTVLTDAFNNVQNSTQELFETPHRSFLKVRCGTSFAQRWLINELPDFAEKHAQYRLRLQTIIWHDALSLDGIDLEICHGYGEYVGLSVQRLLKENWIAVASPDFIKKHGVNTDLKGLNISDLSKLPLISTVGYREGWNQWFSQLGVENSQVQSSYEFDNSTMAIDMTVSGMGVHLGLDSYLHDLLDSGELVKIHPYQMPAECGLYLILPNQEIRPKTKDFCLWLFDALATHPNRDNLDWLHL
jgi:LysR family glycine cleavage system transcriptional activator